MAPDNIMTALYAYLVGWLTARKSLRRYRVTPRHNACAFRRALLREAMHELKRDSAFATLPERRQT